MALSDDMIWIAKAIKDSLLVAVMDGSCINQLCLDRSSTCFILECTKGQNRLMGSFGESLIIPMAPCSEPPDLMVMYVLLSSMEEVNSPIGGAVKFIPIA